MQARLTEMQSAKAAAEASSHAVRRQLEQSHLTNNNLAETVAQLQTDNVTLDASLHGKFLSFPLTFILCVTC